jgi:Zn-dependent protease
LPHINFGALFISFTVLLLSLTVHEAAHAWTADRLGDPTARRLGRVSFNPIVHVDFIGTILLPLLAIFSRLPIIGWAKPVPVNPANLRNFRRDYLLVAAAGPGSNLALAVAAGLCLRAVSGGIDEQSDVNPGGLGATLLLLVIQINVLLAVFNMIPVPPLDGGNVLFALLPPGLARGVDMLRPYGFLVLYGLILTGLLQAMIWPPSRFLMRLLQP